MKTIEYITLIIFAFTSIHCNNPIEPPPLKPPVIKNPSELNWTVDTLQFSSIDQTTMVRIWGSSKDNIYIVGYCSSPGGGMWHFNGNNWAPINLLPATNIKLRNIYGFSADDIWAIGYVGSPPNETGYVVHYDGNVWRGTQLSQSKLLTSIWGSSSADIWTGGKETLFHYDGSTWQKVPFKSSANELQFLSIIGFSASDVYLAGSNLDLSQSPYTEYYLLYHYDGNNVNLVDTTDFITYSHLSKFGVILDKFNNILYSSGQGVFKKAGADWQVELNNNKIAYLGGTGTNNIYACGLDGIIYYYNGTSWQNIVPVQGFNVTLYNIWTDGSEVFIVGNDGWTTYILHGE